MTVPRVSITPTSQGAASPVHMDLNAASLFVRVASTLSFTAAARQLGLPRSTVSKRILELEEELGVKLLNRTSRAVELTEAGSRFLVHAHQAMALLEQAGVNAGATAHSVAAPVRMAVPRLLAQTFGAEFARRVHARSPGLRLVVDVTLEAPELVSGGYDLAVGFDLGRARSRSRNERTRVLREAALSVVGSPTYLAAHPAPERPADLEAHAILALTGERGQVTWPFTSKGRAVHVQLEPRLGFTDALALKRLAIQGLGLTMLPTLLVEAELGQGLLREVLGPHRPPPLRVVLTTRESGPARAPLQTVVEVLQDLAASPWPLGGAA